MAHEDAQSRQDHAKLHRQGSDQYLSNLNALDESIDRSTVYQNLIQLAAKQSNHGLAK